MKIGDLIIATHHPDIRKGEMGIITGFNLDNEPVVIWQSTGYKRTYRSQIEVIQWKSVTW